MATHVAFEAVNGLGLFKNLDRTCEGIQGCRCRVCTSHDLSRQLREPFRSQVRTADAGLELRAAIDRKRAA